MFICISGIHFWKKTVYHESMRGKIAFGICISILKVKAMIIIEEEQCWQTKCYLQKDGDKQI